MKKILFKVLAGVVMIAFAAACGKDTVDEPGNGSTPNGEEVTDPVTPGDNDDDEPGNDAGSNGEEAPDPVTPGDNDDGTPEYKEPEPLTAEWRPVFTKNKRWIKRSVYAPGCERYSETWTALCSENGIVDGRDTWAVYRADEGYEYGNPKWCYSEDEEGSVYLRGSYDYEDPWVFNKIYFFDINVDLPGVDKGFVQSRGTIVLEGKTRRAMRVKFSQMERGYDYWVEGIGPLNASRISYQKIFPSCIAGTRPGEPKYVEILKCYEGEEKIYDIDNFSDDLYTEEEVYFPM